MKKQIFSITLIGLLTVGLFQLFAAHLSLDTLRNLANPATTLAQPAQAAAAQVGATPSLGEFNGAVKLQGARTGVYSDTLALPAPPPAGTPAPPDLGSIDLVLQLNQAGNAVSGHVVLANTLVFTREHTITANGLPLDIGPLVQGSFDGSNLTLVSERVALVVAGRAVQRQFRLIGSLAPGDRRRFTGEYRETLWGYAPQPVTVVGTFTLQGGRVGAAPSELNNKIHLPVIWR